MPPGKTAATCICADEQPERMELLAELLEAKLITKLPAEDAAAYAQEIRAKVTPYRELVDQLRVPKARVKLLERVRLTVIKHGQRELVQLKRLYKVEGFSETEIHKVIPDRPRKPKSSGGGSGAAPPAAE